MPLLFEPIFTPGLAQLSYLVGDKKAGVAAVIDPRRDVEIYIERACAAGVRIDYAIETHIHADFASGARALAARTGAQVVGGRSNAYRFELRQLDGSERLELGGVTLEALHTPGHTPEHLSFLLYDKQQGDAPFALFSGDTLFNLDVGRPDLLGEGSERRLAEALHASLFDILLPLGDRIEVLPCHGAGSACGKSIGDRRQTTIGNERLFNPALQPRDRDAFVDWLLADMPEPPRHYARLKRENARGLPLDPPPSPPPMKPELFRTSADGAMVVDVRSILAFGGGHAPGALSIALRDEFPTWAGRMIPSDHDVLLVGETPCEVAEACLQLYRIGLDRVVGALHDGMTDWQNAGLPLQRIEQWTVHELNARREDADVVVLDVRGDEEVAKGRVPGALHIPLPHLEERLNELDRERLIACYCGSGYRASIAASVLQRAGFERVANTPGSWIAWKAADLPVQS